MYRTTIEFVGGTTLVKREHSTNPELVPYSVSTVASFPDEAAFRILKASKLTAEPSENGVVFRQQEDWQ